MSIDTHVLNNGLAASESPMISEGSNSIFFCVSLPLPHSTVYRPQTINTPPSILYTHKKKTILNQIMNTKASKKNHKFAYSSRPITTYKLVQHTHLNELRFSI